MECKNIAIYAFHSRGGNSNQEISDNAAALEKKYRDKQSGRNGARRVLVRTLNAASVGGSVVNLREHVELRSAGMLTEPLGIYLLTHGGVGQMVPTAAQLAAFVFHSFVKTETKLQKIVIGGCHAAGDSYGDIFNRSQLKQFGDSLLECAREGHVRLPENLMASAYNLLVTTYYAESQFIQERFEQTGMAPDARLAATLPTRPIRTVEFIGGNTQQYRETHRPSAALLDVAMVDNGTRMNTRNLSAALTQMRTDARDTVLRRTHLAGHHASNNRHPLFGLNLNYPSFAAFKAADRNGSERFLTAKRADIASEMTRLFQAKYQNSPTLHTDIANYIRRKLIIKFVRGATPTTDTVVTGSLSEYTDNAPLSVLLSLVEDSLGSAAPAVRFA